MSDPSALPVSIEARRAEVRDALTAAFESDRLELQDFETRLERVREARALATIDAQLVGLEQPSAPVPVNVPRTGTALAIMGGADRRGSWAVPREMTAAALMGGVTLDLREAQLGPHTRIRAYALMGGIEIVVPPSVRVQVDGLGIAGAFEDHTQTDTDGPLVHITGVALMGGVEVSTRLPGESKQQARKRRRTGTKALPRPQG